MNYNIVLTTAEDIVAVVDAIVAKGKEASIEYISSFTGIATADQVKKALHMAQELQLIGFDTTVNMYKVESFLAQKLVMALSDTEKAVFMRLILEQYPPYHTFRERYRFTQSIEVASRQTKVLYSMNSNERDIKNTLVSIATYAKALKSEGANLYTFIDGEQSNGVIEHLLNIISISEASLISYWGDDLYDFVNRENVFQPLCDALVKSKATSIDQKSIVVYAANAFESFLGDCASKLGVSLVGKSGILQKRDALSAHLSKKHRGMIDYIGQIRNAADHGADNDENNQSWIVTTETAIMYPVIVAVLIRDIYVRMTTRSIEV